MIKSPKRYACMPKLKKQLGKSKSDLRVTEYNIGIECYIPVVCYVIADKTNYLPDGTIKYNCEIAYTRNQWNLQPIENPLGENKDNFDTLPMEEVSEDYEIIKAICTQKNKELIEKLWTVSDEDLQRKKYCFLENEIIYFSTCYEPLHKSKVKELKKEG